ncbi:MAG: aerobic C4-dicarboxylate transport protein [Hyphomonadaceae bacterium]|nr:MAG: aerobic C4-dicarboxylate transport protein [Hyphomonadaceae bacterium]
MAILNNSGESAATKGSSLWLQVIVAIILGGLIGTFSPQLGVSLEPLGKAFVNLVKMIIAPVIFLTITTGISGMRDLKGFGSVTIKAFAYFFVFSTFALILGLIVGNLFAPGAGMNAEFAPHDLAKVDEIAGKVHDLTLVGFLSDIIPKTFVSAFVDGNILQVLFISVIFGLSLVIAGEKSRPVVSLLESISHVVFRLVDLLMKAAPIGAFGAIAFVIGKFGLSSIVKLSALVGTFYITSALFIVVVLGSVAKFSGFSIFKLIAYLKNEILLVLGTSSSESALPSLMEKMEQAGVKREIVGLVVPTGYSFNLDGTSIYMTLAALFIAQATNTHLTLADQLALFSVAIISSKGAAGVTGAGFITLAATLSVVPTIPIAGMAIILGVDKFMSECRALTNFIGNAVATIVIGKWENGLNKDALDAALAGKHMPKIAPLIPHAPAAGVQPDEQDSD